ncbi:MAG: hypothetical protein ABI068_01730 [Ktedonobacterales bacterium]
MGYFLSALVARTGRGDRRRIGLSSVAVLAAVGLISVLAISQDSATTAYVALSYPLGVERTTDGGAHWRTVLP